MKQPKEVFVFEDSNGHGEKWLVAVKSLLDIDAGSLLGETGTKVGRYKLVEELRVRSSHQTKANGGKWRDV